VFVLLLLLAVSTTALKLRSSLTLPVANNQDRIVHAKTGGAEADAEQLAKLGYKQVRGGQHCMTHPRVARTAYKVLGMALWPRSRASSCTVVIDVGSAAPASAEPRRLPHAAWAAARVTLEVELRVPHACTARTHASLHHGCQSAMLHGRHA
jgi:hypothetical protein